MNSVARHRHVSVITSKVDEQWGSSATGSSCAFGRCYTYSEVPDFYRREHVTEGYRQNYTWLECCHSAVQVHNETWDIYSHLIPSLIMLANCVDVLLHPGRYNSTFDKFMMSLIPFGAFVTFGWSALSHTFHVQSVKLSRFMFKMDWFFIASMVTSSHLAVGAFMFHDKPDGPFSYYMALFGVTTALSFASNAMPWFHSPSFKALRPVVQASAFVIGGAMQLHWIVFYEGISVYSTMLLKTLWTTYFVLITAVSIYALDFPERYFAPNKWTTYLFYSHQVFHVISSSGIIYFFYGVHNFYDLYCANGGRNIPESST